MGRQLIGNRVMILSSLLVPDVWVMGHGRHGTDVLFCLFFVPPCAGLFYRNTMHLCYKVRTDYEW